MVEEGGNPILEGGIVIASNILDMLLQDHLIPAGRESGAGAATVLAVFPAVPQAWSEARFFHLRCLNGFVVSAVRREGYTAWVEVISEGGRTPVLIEADFGGEPKVIGKGVSIVAAGARWELAGLTQPGQAVIIQGPHADAAAVAKEEFVVEPLAGNRSQHNYYGWGADAHRAVFGGRIPTKTDDPSLFLSARLLLGLACLRGVDSMLFPEDNNGYDLWLYREQSAFYMYFISGSTGADPNPTPAQKQGGNWDHIGAASSADGVHFSPLGPVLNVPANETRNIDWLGSGAVWPLLGQGRDRAKKKRYVINYSGAFSHHNRWDGAIDYQKIYFATSDDLIQWQPQPQATFQIDTRWYNNTQCCIMRWDCMSVVCKDPGLSPGQCKSGYHALFTASPLPTCPTCPDNKDGLGFAESDDGLHWVALRPITQGTPGSRWPHSPPIGGEVGSVNRIGSRVFVVIGGRLNSAPSIEGPYTPTLDNPLVLNGPINSETSNSACTNGACWSFPRLWDLSTDTENLTLMTVNRLVGGHTAYSDALKEARVDENGTLRLSWWKGNDAMRGRPLPVVPPSGDGTAAALSSFRLTQWDLSAGLMLTAGAPAAVGSDDCVGVAVANGSDSGWVGCWHRTRGVGLIGGARLNRTGFEWAFPPTVVERGQPFDASGPLGLRLVARTAKGSVGTPFRSGGFKKGTHTMIDVYIQDYLLAVWTLNNATGLVGLTGMDGGQSLSPCDAGCEAHAMTFRGEVALPE